MRFLPHHAHDALDRDALLGILRFKLGPDIVRVPLAVVQIARHARRLPAGRLHLLERKVIERIVIRLKVDLPARHHHLAVHVQKCAVRQAALRLILSGPRIAEIDEDPVDLALAEKLEKSLRVAPDKEQILQALALRLLHREQAA